MEIEIISFGKIAEFIVNQKLVLNNVNTTDELKTYLEDYFPKLLGMKYKLALNKQIVQVDTKIIDHDTIAIMPPFSGG